MTTSHPYPPDPGPLRCDAAEITAALAATARPESRVILDRPVDVVAGPVRLTTGRLWRIALWHDPAADQLTWTMAARSPDGRCWDHGCQRQWLTTGAVIEPLDALAPLERQALRDRLLCAVCWPVPEPPSGQAVMTLQAPVEEAKPARRRRVRR